MGEFFSYTRWVDAEQICLPCACKVAFVPLTTRWGLHFLRIFYCSGTVCHLELHLYFFLTFKGEKSINPKSVITISCKKTPLLLNAPLSS